MQLRAAGSRAPRNQPIKPRSSWAILSSKFRLTGGTTMLLNVPPPSLSPISNTKSVLRRRRGEHLTSGSGTTMWLATNKQQALNSSQRALSGRLYFQVRIQAAQNTTIRLLPTVGDLRCQRPKAAQACPDRLPQHRAPLMGEKRQCVVVPNGLLPAAMQAHHKRSGGPEGKDIIHGWRDALHGSILLLAGNVRHILAWCFRRA